MKKLFDILTVVIICAVFSCVALLNVFQTRPAVSENENRALAEMPVFSIKGLLDGSYFNGVERFFSDTFVFREQFVRLSKNAQTWMGDVLFLSSDDGVLFIPVAAVSETRTPVKELPEITTADTVRETEPVTDVLVLEMTETTAPSEPETEPETEWETESETESVTEAQTDSLTAALTEPQVKLDSITLSNTVLFMPQGTSQSLEAYVTPDGVEGVMVSWTTSNAKTASLSVRNDKLYVTGESVGHAVVTASAGGKTAQCSITVISKTEENMQQNTTDEPEILTSGLFLYRGAVYSIPYLVESNARLFAQTTEYYASLFPKSKVSVVIAPLSSAMLDRGSFGKRLTDQRDIITVIGSYMNNKVSNVEIYDALFSHRDEYLYFRSDHHWTARGAYYAYAEFAKSTGFEPVDISKLEERLLNDKMLGSMIGYTGDERVKKMTDSLYVYLPRKPHTMTVYRNGSSYRYDSSVLVSSKNYGCFIASDNPYTVINVPENPQNVNILVLKDSFGNAMIPYLTEHYGNIIVVDPRHVTFDIYELLKNYPLRDILFLNNIYNPNVYSWSLNLLRSVGAD